MTQLTDRLFSHIEEERRAILSGSYADLSDIAAARSVLMTQLELHPPQSDVLSLIGRRAARNLKLLEAAMQGVKDAADRLRALREVKNGFDTYGSDGQRQAHDTLRPSFEKKA